MDFTLILFVAFGVGTVVGITGMGGGALMTPALMLLGISPTVAVANDLVSSAVSRSAGATMHWRQGSSNMKLAKWLIIGSVPSAFAGAFIIKLVGPSDSQQHFVTVAMGVALLAAAITYVLRVIVSFVKKQNNVEKPTSKPKIRPLATMLVGVAGGLLVGLTSVGAGSIIMVALLLLYPGLKSAELVGTDLVQAVPLVIAAALSHVITTGVDWSVLLPLIIGSTPGTYLGAKLSTRVKPKYVRRGIITALTITGLYLLGITPWLALLIGLTVITCGLLILPTTKIKLAQAFSKS